MRSAWIGLAFLLACGGRTQLGGTLGDSGADAGLPQPQAQGIVERSCAPNDGPAYSFALAGSPPMTCASTTATAGTVAISIWSPFPTGPGSYPIGGSGSTAFVCATGPNDCVMATHGTLVLTELSATPGGKSAGSYTLFLPDGTVVTAGFADAVFCDTPPMCG